MLSGEKKCEPFELPNVMLKTRLVVNPGKIANLLIKSDEKEAYRGAQFQGSKVLVVEFSSLRFTDFVPYVLLNT